MSSPISSPGVSLAGSSWELYPENTQEALDNPSTSRAICHSTDQQVSTIARCDSSKNLVEQNPYDETTFLNWKNPPMPLGRKYSIIIAEAFVKLLEEGGINHNFIPAKAQKLIEDAFVKLVEERGITHSLTPDEIQELITGAVVKLLKERGINHNFTPDEVQEIMAAAIVKLLKERGIDYNFTPDDVQDIIIGALTKLFEEKGINHVFTPTEAQEFANTMYAIQRPISNKITRNMKEGTSTIEFRPQHGLCDIHSFGLFLKQRGGFAGCVADVEQKCEFNEKEVSHSSINLTNYRDLAYKKHQLLWENRAPEDSEEYELPKSRYSDSNIYSNKKKTSDQLEKQLSFQKRLLQRAVEKLHIDGKPFDPAFIRIFKPTDKERRSNEIALSTAAKVTGIFFEYKRKTVPLEQERACIAEINAMPTYTIDQICDAIKADLKEHPITIVDLHQISHLLEKLGGYASSSALVEREYIIDGQEERHCTAIILRNRQDLVNQRYEYLRETYSAQFDLSNQAPQCNYPVPFLQKKKTTEEAKKQLLFQARLLQRAVQEMIIDEEPFDPLFERIYIPTEQERISNGASIANLAQTDMILFVYRTSSEDRPPKYAVEQICESMKTMAEAEEIKTPMAETNIISRTAQTCLSLLKQLGKDGDDFLSHVGG